MNTHMKFHPRAKGLRVQGVNMKGIPRKCKNMKRNFETGRNELKTKKIGTKTEQPTATRGQAADC